jgi:hypothetical protein
VVLVVVKAGVLAVLLEQLMEAALIKVARVAVLAVV